MTGRPEVALLVPIHAPALERLEREFHVHRAFPADDPVARLRDEAGGSRIMVTTGLAGFDAAHLDALPALELVAVYGVGHGTLDIEGARARGIAVANTPDSTHTAVAELAIGLILAITRGIPEADRFVRAGRWSSGPFGLGRGLSGRRIGIIGYGRIGRRLAERLEPFGVETAYHARHAVVDATIQRFPSLSGLAEWSDILVVACPLTEASRGMVNAETLRELGPEGFLVNVARGPIVDRDALVAAIAEWIDRRRRPGRLLGRARRAAGAAQERSSRVAPTPRHLDPRDTGRAHARPLREYRRISRRPAATDARQPVASGCRRKPAALPAATRSNRSPSRPASRRSWTGSSLAMSHG